MPLTRHEHGKGRGEKGKSKEERRKSIVESKEKENGEQPKILGLTLYLTNSFFFQNLSRVSRDSHEIWTVPWRLSL